MLNLIFFGPPGAGKGTQALKTAGHYGLMHISTGNMLREEVERNTQLGMKVKDILGRGELVPDELLVELLGKTVHSRNSGGFIFDGFPRTLTQAKALDHIMKRIKSAITRVIFLQVPEEELLRRLMIRSQEQGRTDDTPEVIKKRLAVYYQHTRPLISFYSEKGLLCRIPGIGTIEDVFRDICRIIDKPY